MLHCLRGDEERQDMKKQIVEVDKARGMFRVTTTDERFYTLASMDEITGLPVYRYIPSVTWIAGCYPKGIEFYKWLANNGWDESQAIKKAAGEKGSKVHNAIELWLKGELVIGMDTKVMNQEKGEAEELSVEEYEAIMTFIDWYKEVKPEILRTECTVVNEACGYAGTVDIVAKIGGDVWIIDLKTSQYVWSEYELQLSAYKAALESESGKHPDYRLAILQIGYKKNKAGYKWNIIADKFGLFLSAKDIWANEHNEEKPKQKDYPLLLPSKSQLDTEPKADIQIKKPKTNAIKRQEQVRES